MSHNTELTNMLKMLISQKNSTPIVCETPVVQTQIIETPVVKTENIEIFIEDEANEDDDVDDDVDEDEDEDETNEAEIKIIEPIIVKKPKQSTTDKLQNILNEQFHYAENLEEFITHLNQVSIISAVDANDPAMGNIFNTMIPKGLITSEKDAMSYLKDKIKRCLQNTRTPLAVYNKKLYVKISNEWILHTNQISRISTKFMFLFNDAVSNLETKITPKIINKYEMYKTYNVNNIKDIIDDALMWMPGIMFDDDKLNKLQRQIIKE